MRPLLRWLCCFSAPPRPVNTPATEDDVEEEEQRDRMTWRRSSGRPRRRPERPPISSEGGAQTN
ncbi:hypothetical protein SAY86_017183 [Trapa natans]|uniref:Uncharacterized protein n=1 Tax=Trapa natans TaxID=22666 RepID=A0AAN7LQV8_TRANT|nr:hypothetical protein SAY86_017183 [Trapa natans]